MPVRSQLQLCSILLLLVVTLNACVTPRLAEATLIEETSLTIRRIRIATDGAIVLDVEPTITRFGGEERVKRRRFLLGAEENILENRRWHSAKPLISPTPPILPSEHLEIIPYYISYPPPNPSYYGHSDLLWDLVPTKLLGKDALDAELGDSFQNCVLEYLPNEPIPYSLHGVDITISFPSHAEFYPLAPGRPPIRTSQEWFYYPLWVPSVLIDSVILIVLSPVLIPAYFSMMANPP